ncbi:ankyrin repeat-containing domain protein [Xylariaceae sp. FL0255]|nr:ankyrin repeat-containing domain protein [Xylariaceae sp. FL0255]
MDYVHQLFGYVEGGLQWLVSGASQPAVDPWSEEVIDRRAREGAVERARQKQAEEEALPFGNQQGIGFSHLYKAAGDNDVDKIADYIKGGADPNRLERHSKRVPLHSAAIMGHLDAVRMLLDSGAEIDIPSEAGTALEFAMDHRHEDVARLLIERGATLELPEERGTFLHVAIYGGMSVEFIELLMERGNFDVNNGNDPSGTPLMAAIRRANTKAASWLLAHGADGTKRGGNLDNLLQVAAYTNHIAMARALIHQMGVDVNIAGGEYGNALQAACYAKTHVYPAYNGDNSELVKMLLDAGADINAVGGTYGTALHAACYSGNIEATKILLERGADPRIVGGKYGSTLKAAIESRKFEIIALLIEHGVEISPGMELATEVLEVAAGSKQTQVMEKLLDNGLNINATSERSFPLRQAVWNGDVGMVKLLLERGADVNLCIKRKENYEHDSVAPALYAAIGSCESYGRSKEGVKAAEEIVTILLDAGADPNMDFPEKQTPLCAATDRMLGDGSVGMQLKVMQILLDRGADINKRSEHHMRQTPLEAAARNKNGLELVKFLLEKGADVNATDSRGHTALISAIGRKECEENVKILLDYGAEINPLDDLEEPARTTSLIEASLEGNLPVVEILLDRGADINYRTKAGTALQAARYKRRTEVEEFLRARGAEGDAEGGLFGIGDMMLYEFTKIGVSAAVGAVRKNIQ